MVRVYADGAPIYAPDLEGHELLGLTATPSVEKAGTAEIVLPPDHPAYDSFVEYKTLIEIFRGDEMLFRGRALYPADDMYRRRTITCEGERCYLRDSLLRPYLYQDTPANIFKDLIAQHNAQVDAFKRFRLGEITVKDDNDYVRLEGGSAESVASVLDKLVGRCGGYLVFTTAADGARVINWYASIGRTCSQMIEFGENLLDYSSTGANTNLATAILPYGAKNETSGLRTTIETVNGGLDYIQDDEAVARHGFIIQPLVWDDVTKPSNLLTKARQYLDTSKNIVTSLELTAVDLSVMDKDIETFRVGDWVLVYSEPHGVHSAFQLRERTYDLLNPANDRVVLGKDLTTLTGQTTALEDEVVLKAVELSTRIGQNKYNELDNLIQANSTAIEQTAEKVASKADQADYDTLGQQVSKNTSSIEQMAGKIESTVTREEFDELGEQVASNKSTITQTAKDIRAEVADEIEGVNSTITQTAKDIRAEVSDEVEGLSGRIDASAESISAEVKRAEAAEEALSGRIDVQADKVELAVNRTVGGTNLVGCAEGGIWVKTGNVSYNWPTDDYYSKSGVGIVMTPWTGSHNEIRFYTDIDVRPGEYTLSFYSWYTYLTTNISIRLNLLSNDPNVSADIYFDEHAFMPPPSTPTKHSFVLNVNHKGKVILRFVTMTPWSVGNVFFSDVKLEKGNTATDWSPCPDDPAERVDNRNGIVIDEKGIYMEGGEIDLRTTAGDQYLNITPEGVSASSLRAPNVAPMYGGAATITVNPDVASDPANGVYRTLIEACGALNGRHMPYSVTINVQGDSYGFVDIYGICGSTHGLTINGNGHSLTGGFRAANCSTHIAINRLTFSYESSYNKDYTANFDNCAHVEMNQCVVNGNSLVARGLHLAWGTKAILTGCEFYNVTDSAIKAGDNVDLVAVNAKGDSPYFVWADGSVIKWKGTRPGGDYWEGLPSICNDFSKLTIDYGSATPSIRPPRTVEYPMLYADSYAVGYENSWNYQSHDDIMQGYTEHAGHIFGCIWFDNAAIRSAGINTVNQATIRLKAQTYVGRGVAVEVHLWGTTTEYAGRSGAPELTKDYKIIGTATPGEVTTISIPIEAAADLASGTINGLVLYSDDETLYKDRNYSQNYMKFDGGTSGDSSTRPVLTITYQ